MTDSDQAQDVATINYVLRLLDAELQKYPPDSKESIALWKFKEVLDDAPR